MGPGGAIGSLNTGIAGAGVMLKSMHDYQRELQLEQQSDEMHAANMRSRNMANDSGALDLEAKKRQADWDAEDRATAATHMNAMSPENYQPPPQPTPAVPAVAPDTTSDQSADGAGNAPAAQASPPPQPMPASALPGTTFNASPPSITPPPSQGVAAAQQQINPTVAPFPYQPSGPGSGRMGLYDVLAEKARRRGDFNGEAKYRGLKDAAEKEGFGRAAHESLLDPGNVVGITKAFNEPQGNLNIVPGTLVANKAADGKYTGTYNMTVRDANGQTRELKDFSMTHAAIALGVIAPPKLVHFGADQNVFSQDASGNISPVQGAQKFEGKINRQGDVFILDKVSGRYTVQHSDGTESKLSTEQSKALTEIDQLARHVSTERNNENLTAENKKPGFDTPQVSATAQSIFVNNPGQRQNGLSGPKAVEIATAMNDGNALAVTGRAMRADGFLWNVVKFGKGDDAVTYGISKVQTQPKSPVQPKVRTQNDLPPAESQPVSVPVRSSLPRPPKEGDKGYDALIEGAPFEENNQTLRKLGQQVRVYRQSRALQSEAAMTYAQYYDLLQKLKAGKSAV